jgi:hypothetical protein
VGFQIGEAEQDRQWRHKNRKKLSSLAEVTCEGTFWISKKIPYSSRVKQVGQGTHHQRLENNCAVLGRTGNRRGLRLRKLTHQAQLPP